MRLLANGELLIWGRVFDLPTTGRQPAISEFVLLAGHRPIPDDQLAAIATAADFPVPRWNGPPTYLRRVDWQGRSFPSTSGGRALGLLTHGTIGVPCAVTLARRASTAAIEGAMARELPVGDVVQAAADAEGGGWLNAVLQWEELTNRARP
jgi:hypothetical protein